MKPLPTLMRPLRSVDLASGEPGEALVERSDVQAVEALAVVAEAAVAWELARAAREKFGGDALTDFVGAHAAYLERIAWPHALGRHLVLVGFMGAGKSTVGPGAAERLGRPFLDVDGEVEATHGPIWELFARRGRGGLPRARGALLARCLRARRAERRSRSEVAPSRHAASSVNSTS